MDIFKYARKAKKVAGQTLSNPWRGNRRQMITPSRASERGCLQSVAREILCQLEGPQKWAARLLAPSGHYFAISMSEIAFRNLQVPEAFRIFTAS
jgi:hypothetical protein